LVLLDKYTEKHLKSINIHYNFLFNDDIEL